jgi:hypothetical protein
MPTRNSQQSPQHGYCDGQPSEENADERNRKAHRKIILRDVVFLHPYQVTLAISD